MLRFKRIPRTFGFEVKLGETSQGNKPFHSEILKFELGPLSIFEPCPGTTFSKLVPDRFQNQFSKPYPVFRFWNYVPDFRATSPLIDLEPCPFRSISQSICNFETSPFEFSPHPNIPALPF